MELSVLLHDDRDNTWRAYGVFPAGSGDNAISSPCGSGSTPDKAVEALLGHTTAEQAGRGLSTALWACGDAVGALARACRR